MHKVTLSGRHRVRWLRILRNVFGKLSGLVSLSVFALGLFEWRDSFGERVVTDDGDLVVAALIAAAFAMLVVFDTISEALSIFTFEVTLVGASLSIRTGSSRRTK